VVNLSKKKRRRKQSTAAGEKKSVVAEILIGVISGILTAAIAKWLDL
jgi:hypothetical protein